MQRFRFHIRRLFIIAAALLPVTPAASRAPGEADTVPAQDTVTLRQAIRSTWENFKETRRVEIVDTVIKYPKLIQFGLDVYNWVDRNLNSYDPEYVSPTGKHGKVRLVSDNWTDLYYFRFKEISPLIMASNIYSNIGVQANYSILSASYSIDLNSAINHKKSHHKKTGFSLSMARLYLEATYWRNTGETVIRHFGNDYTGHLRHLRFEGLNSKALGVAGFYIFNFSKFSYAAAYNLSNYQIKSAGSWIAGASGTFYDCAFDFGLLPESVKAETNFPFDNYSFDYNAVDLFGGYAYNWVINKHLLFNATLMPGMGAAFSFSDSTNGREMNFSAVVRALGSLTYTNRQFFVTATTNFNGNLMLSKDVGYMSGLENFQISTGVRF